MVALSKYRGLQLAIQLWSAFLVALFLCSLPIQSQTQTADEVEKRLASLPPDQRAYERFRFWSTVLPPDQQRDPNLLTRYREYLKARGFGDGDAEAQLWGLAAAYQERLGSALEAAT